MTARERRKWRRRVLHGKAPVPPITRPVGNDGQVWRWVKENIRCREWVTDRAPFEMIFGGFGPVSGGQMGADNMRRAMEKSE